MQGRLATGKEGDVLMLIICPLMSYQCESEIAQDDYIRCRKYECAWYVDESEQCCIKELVEILDRIHECMSHQDQFDR